MRKERKMRKERNNRRNKPPRRRSRGQGRAGPGCGRAKSARTTTRRIADAAHPGMLLRFWSILRYLVILRSLFWRCGLALRPGAPAVPELASGVPGVPRDQACKKKEENESESQKLTLLEPWPHNETRDRGCQASG